MTLTNKFVQHEILEEIKKHNTIIIHRHVNPDPDALGSQGGLATLIQATFPEKKVYVVGEEVDGLTFLIGMDSIEDSVYEGALVIVCDTANTERISDQRYNLGATLIKIDHHPDREPYGDFVWVDTNFSSASEMIMDFYSMFDDVFKLTDKAARLLYAGIIGDTGRFLYDNTTASTLQYASDLLTYKFSPQELFNEFYKTSKNSARLHGYILQHFEVTESGVAYMFLSKELLQEFGVSQTEGANLVNVLSNIEGNKIWVFFVEYDDDYRVRIRSKNTPIDKVANAFSGGGHPLASGATVTTKKEGLGLIKALDEVLN